MLCQFSVSNFKSFKGKLSLRLDQPKQYSFNSHLLHRDKLVKNALVYGYNGYGKSNLGFALMDILANLSDKQTATSYYNKNYTNAYNADDQLASFEYLFSFEDIKVDYRYQKASYQDIRSETLSIDGERVLHYHRNKSADILCSIEGTETLELGMDIEIPLLRYIYRNSMRKPESRHGKALAKLFSFVNRMLHFRHLEDIFYQGFETGRNDIMEDIIQKEKLENLESFLKEANIDFDLLWVTSMNGSREIRIKMGEKTLPLSDIASSGTISLILFYYWYLRCLQDGEHPSLIFIDEYDAFYHSEVAALVFRKLAELEDCQSILTTHNLELFSNRHARPDCLYLMSFDAIAPIAQLSDRGELREVHNLAKLYKGGDFQDKLKQLKDA